MDLATLRFRASLLWGAHAPPRAVVGASPTTLLLGKQKKHCLAYPREGVCPETSFPLH
jgi:hypothetical protein